MSHTMPPKKKLKTCNSTNEITEYDDRPVYTINAQRNFFHAIFLKIRKDKPELSSILDYSWSTSTAHDNNSSSPKQDETKKDYHLSEKTVSFEDLDGIIVHVLFDYHRNSALRNFRWLTTNPSAISSGGGSDSDGVNEITKKCDEKKNGIRNEKRTAAAAPPPAGAIVGIMKFLLVFYKVMVCPEATTNEVAYFLYNCTPDGIEPQMYPPNEIKRSLTTMGITKQFLERREMIADRAALPASVMERNVFWNSVDFGVKGIPLSEMIDWGEVYLYVKTDSSGVFGNRCFLANSNHRVNPYRRSKKYAFAFAISGCERGNIWIDGLCELKGNDARSVYEICSFLSMILEDVGDGNDTHRRTFISDDPIIDKHDLPWQVIASHYHRLRKRPSYYPGDGPIHWALTHIQDLLSRRMGEIRNEEELKMEMFRIIRGMSNLEAYFRYSGYQK